MAPATTSMPEEAGKMAALASRGRRQERRAPELPPIGVKIILRPKDNLDLQLCSHAALHGRIRHAAGVNLEDAL